MWALAWAEIGRRGRIEAGIVGAAGVLGVGDGDAGAVDVLEVVGAADGTAVAVGGADGTRARFGR